MSVQVLQVGTVDEVLGSSEGSDLGSDLRNMVQRWVKDKHYDGNGSGASFVAILVDKDNKAFILAAKDQESLQKYLLNVDVGYAEVMELKSLN